MNRGYIKLWRKRLESIVFLIEGLLKVLIWGLLRANHKETFVRVKTGRGISEVKLIPGTFLFGRESAAKELHMSPSTVWKRILKLKKLEFLNIESNSHYSIVYIINWTIYQAVSEDSDSERNRQVTGKEHRQECKECKEDILLSDSIEIRLSELLLEKITSRNPGFKKPNIQTWARHIDLMIRVDKRVPSEISKVIAWCQQDQFWQNNILSTAKLRKQFDRLLMQMNAEGIKGDSRETSRPISESFECQRCKKRIIVKSDLTESGCIYCEMEACT